MWQLVIAVLMIGNPNPLAIIETPYDFDSREVCLEFGAKHQVIETPGFVVQGECVETAQAS